jgi:hypothetical protein
MNADPRLHERKQPERRVFCKLGGDESCSVLNLSEDGLCFQSLTPIGGKDSLHLRLSVDLSNPIEATARLAWFDSAKHTGGLRFLELSAPAREQIRAWLSETSTASSARNGAAAEKLVVWQKTIVPSMQLAPAPSMQLVSVPTMQLVPIERHRAQMRWHFRLGVLLGFGISTAVMITVSQYGGGTNLVSLVRAITSPNPAAQSSEAQAQAPVTQPASPSTSLSEPTAAKLLVKDPAGRQTVPVAAPIWSPQRQRPQAAGTSSSALMTRTSLASAAPQPAPEPTNDDQPLATSQAAVASAPADSKAQSSSGQVQNSKKLPATPQQLWSALQAGNMKAAVALADLYIRGEGVPENCEQARILLQVASKRNNAEASEKLLELDKSGCPASSE